MQISSSYSMSGVPYDIKHRNGSIHQDLPDDQDYVQPL